MIKWAVKYEGYFTVYTDKAVADSVARDLHISPIKVRGVYDAGGINCSKILGKIGNEWYVRCDNG